MQGHRRFQCGRLLIVLVGLGIALYGRIAIADSVPESIRIQEQAEKAYETAPVVPIERGNAHHREQMKDDGTDGSGYDGYVPQAAPPPPADERRDDKAK
ncbi:MAG: hypothetical protein QM780_16570 [Hyphomicrobium sp.]|uniref:hypothetical protein n=1 Tax=Hyphomicrobium sp. TaxID=82 RepID=UPI0039E3AD23